ncbi:MULTISPECIES: TIR-like protein FxsC [Micromonospora]|uniref:TIR-like protein FxsC n=1 Tax=Micromonospora TaxID=1873 RepID=UPI0021C80E3D|nr:TIR-like protein FxsC [Micromonospora sp. Mcm103]
MTSERPTLPGPPYFFLSYVPPPTHNDRTPGDHWVRRFYHDLNLAIDGRPGDRVRRQGFADFMVRPPEARTERKRTALAEAEVFVPLYSPDYLNRDDSRREREWFRQRLIRAGRPPDGDNILPVLWIPSPAALHAPDQARAVAMAADVDVYAANGMSALCRLQKFQDAYKEVLGRLAQHIVDTAEHTPLQPAEPPTGPTDLPSSPTSEVPFRAVVIAPDQPVDPGRLNGRSDTHAGRWRPFRGRPPVIEDVTDAVQRLRMPIDVCDFVPDAGLFRSCPGVLMIDPLVVETPDGAEAVQAAVDCLHGWVGVVLISEDAHHAHRSHAAGLLDRAVTMLSATTRPLKITTWDDWRTEIHDLVRRMRRRYLEAGPTYPPPGPPINKPRLWENPPSDEGVDT